MPPPLRTLPQPFRLISQRTPPSRRLFSTPPPPPAPKDSRSRLHRLNDRLPPFLRSYTTPLLGAPATHITSFLILHEITAVVSLFGLVAAFHYGTGLPDMTSNSLFQEQTQRFGRWLRKKGWVEEADVDKAVGEYAGDAHRGSESESDSGQSAVLVEGEREGVRLILEFATAYIITKALMPVRIAVSVWATPWFSRVVLGPLGRGARGVFGRK
ncbi:hypothetical protein BO94DRAFT_586008 [Aspergillus sclerotioniger CBS 115572]|uniref:Uncharacterized protein n=1 Tax=Aspergillus sclerotioniger CBS 115572 TaxID=1450535 RepID=A0A317WIY4_9EURO|nr:hypothetical protein BO94DRAFT_586008 [Aspergillus sclerotioniger CBS 115572]PWY86424.1 hypothetical protein BO94DRAFT_586008 [Aspergillus sclerotioniger CBS 115572]